MRRMNVGGLFLQSTGGRKEAMARWDGGRKAGAGAAAVPETRRQYETWPLERSVLGWLSHLPFCDGEMGGSVLRITNACRRAPSSHVCYRFLISRRIRCDGVLTGDDASNQWLDALDGHLMAQPCERGAAPHPPPPTERQLPAATRGHATNHHASTTEHLPLRPSHCPITYTFSASTCDQRSPVQLSDVPINTRLLPHRRRRWTTEVHSWAGPL